MNRTDLDEIDRLNNLIKETKERVEARTAYIIEDNARQYRIIHKQRDQISSLGVEKMALANAIDDYKDTIILKDKQIRQIDIINEELEADIVKSISMVSKLEDVLKHTVKELEKNTSLNAKYKEALTEIAEYDFDVHKKAYLLNDFFQQRAKTALSEE